MQLISSLFNNLVSSVVALVEEKREEGQTLVEYALIIALISLLVIGLAAIIAPQLTTTFNEIKNGLAG